MYFFNKEKRSPESDCEHKTNYLLRKNFYFKTDTKCIFLPVIQNKKWRATRRESEIGR